MEADKIAFHLAPEVERLDIVGAYFVVADLKNRPGDPDFEAFKQETLADVARAYAGSETNFATEPVLAGFRDLHTRIGRSNRKFVASSEALLGRFLRTGTLPSVNLLVDIYNLVSVKTRLSLGAHDVARIEGNVTLRLTTGDERFWPLGADAPQPVFPREYAYVDDANEVICRMEVLQVEKTKVGLDTREAFFIVQGNANTPPDYVLAAAAELGALVRRFCGGRERTLSHTG
ncbi:MAG: B3/B4 domain-containing protein [Chloroflexota bacterium]